MGIKNKNIKEGIIKSHINIQQLLLVMVVILRNVGVEQGSSSTSQNCVVGSCYFGKREKKSKLILTVLFTVHSNLILVMTVIKF